jgi:hypothetical protein
MSVARDPGQVGLDAETRPMLDFNTSQREKTWEKDGEIMLETKQSLGRIYT